MGQYKTIERGVEVNGKTILSFIDGVPSAFEEKTLTILAENGIDDPDPDEWYPQEAWLNAFKEINETVGDATLKRIGESIPENADWPDDIESVVDGLDSIDEAYHMNHRGGKIGHYDAEQVAENTVQVECTNPYPCAFDTGIIESVARTFADTGVPRVSETGDSCRSDGDNACLYEVRW